MKKKIIPFLLLVFLWCFSLSACQQQAAQEQQTEATETATAAGYRVIAIKDGDTIELLKDGKPVRVRLYGVDAPEKNQDFGTRARQFTSDLVFGKSVQLEIKDTDRYGRTVGVIYLADGRSLNEELVRAGFAWHYKAYSKNPELGRLEEEARRAKRGLWVDPQPTAPWDFRKGRRTKSQESSLASARPETAAADKAQPGSSASRVYLCDSKGAGTYHLDAACRQLKNCQAAIKPTSRQTASQQLNRKACKVCAD